MTRAELKYHQRIRLGDASERVYLLVSPYGHGQEELRILTSNM